MRGGLAAALLSCSALALPAGGCAAPPRARPPSSAQGAPAAARGAPDWIPAYTPAQLALLAPVDRPVQVPAARVFPDLERFGYANSRPVGSPEEAVKFTKMVATVLTDSPRFYALDQAAPELANPVVQYGPPAAAEPDAWATFQRSDPDTGRLVEAVVPEEARAELARAEKLGQAKDAAGAAAAYRAAIAKAPRVPALRLSLADSLLAAGDVAGAEAAYKEVIGVDPTLSPAYVGLASVAEKRNDLAAARHAIAEALAYHPSSARALEVARRLGATDAGRVRPFAIFLDVDSVGAIHAGASGGNPAQMYAGCRAVLRYEPDVRAAIFEQPPATPYYLSVVEEVVCLEAALGAYLVDRAGDPAVPPSPQLDALLQLAHEEGLSAYAMFEILGQHRPERARMAPADVHHAVVRYVEGHVLGAREGAPPGVYTAGR